MCQSILVKISGRWQEIETVGEARAFFAHGLIFDETCFLDTPAAGREFKDEECLCWLDIERTAAANGYVATNQHGGDPMEWHFTPLEAT